jgi:hypothetical protein
MISRTSTNRAAVDWVALQIQLSERSNFMTVQDELRIALQLAANHTPFVEAMDETSGRSASIFRFRIQNPRQAKVDQVVARLRQRFDFGPVQVVGIEVAFDTYRQGANVQELAEIAADRYRFLTTAPGNDWYFYRCRGEGRRYINDSDEIGNRRDLVKHFAEGWQLTDRDSQAAEVRFHAYVKTWDNGRQLLPQAYRARLEVTLQGAALPCSTLDQLARFNFASLAKHFKFRRLAADLLPVVRHPLMTWTKQQLGRRGRYRRPNRNKIGTYSGVSAFKGSTVADDELNAITYECLRKLTRDWRSKRANADFPEDFGQQSREIPRNS